MKHISSRENPLFKTLVKLGTSSRERRKSGKAVLDGMHLVEAYVKSIGIPEILVISDSGKNKNEIASFLQHYPAADVVCLSDPLFAEVSPVQTPTGIVALIETPVVTAIPDNMTFCVLLEDIQDAGNLGSILRSAAAAGAGQAFLSPQCAYAWSPKTLRAGMGAHFSLAIHEGADLSQIAADFNGQVIATSPDAAVPLDGIDLTGATAFLIGNEGAGLTELLLSQATERVYIPMPGAMESLNAGAAAAICFFEKVRQHRQLKTAI